MKPSRCSNPIAFLLGAALLALTASSTAADSSQGAVYETKIKFEKNRSLHFPDFELTYRGKRHVEPPQYPRGWWAHDFAVRHKAGEQTVSWSAGTGDIGPVRFRVNGAEFQLELSRSDRLGSLQENELVVSPVQ